MEASRVCIPLSVPFDIASQIKSPVVISYLDHSDTDWPRMPRRNGERVTPNTAPNIFPLCPRCQLEYPRANALVNSYHLDLRESSCFSIAGVPVMPTPADHRYPSTWPSPSNHVPRNKMDRS